MLYLVKFELFSKPKKKEKKEGKIWTTWYSPSVLLIQTVILDIFFASNYNVMSFAGGSCQEEVWGHVTKEASTYIQGRWQLSSLYEDINLA